MDVDVQVEGGWGKGWRGEESVVRQGDGGSNVLSWEIEGAYRCRWQRDGGRRKRDRLKERQHGESGRGSLTAVPPGELGLFFEPLSDSFLFLPTCYPLLFFSITFGVLSVGVSSGHLPTCLLPPLLALSLSDTHFFALFPQVPWGTRSFLCPPPPPPPPLSFTPTLGPRCLEDLPISFSSSSSHCSRRSKMSSSYTDQKHKVHEDMQESVVFLA